MKEISFKMRKNYEQNRKCRVVKVETLHRGGVRRKLRTKEKATVAILKVY